MLGSDFYRWRQRSFRNVNFIFLNLFVLYMLEKKLKTWTYIVKFITIHSTVVIHLCFNLHLLWYSTNSDFTTMIFSMEYSFVLLYHYVCSSWKYCFFSFPLPALFPSFFFQTCKNPFWNSGPKLILEFYKGLLKLCKWFLQTCKYNYILFM